MVRTPGTRNLPTIKDGVPLNSNAVACSLLRARIASIVLALVARSRSRRSTSTPAPASTSRMCGSLTLELTPITPSSPPINFSWDVTPRSPGHRISRAPQPPFPPRPFSPALPRRPPRHEVHTDDHRAGAEHAEGFAPGASLIQPGWIDRSAHLWSPGCVLSLYVQDG